jgi:hypothetical protein
MVPFPSEIGSPEDVNRMWDLISRHNLPASQPYRVEFSISCPTRTAGEFLAQYLERSLGFCPAAPQPAVSPDSKEYWDLNVTSSEGSPSLAFLRQVCNPVFEATRRFGCHLYGWGKAHGDCPAA